MPSRDEQIAQRRRRAVEEGLVAQLLATWGPYTQWRVSRPAGGSTHLVELVWVDGVAPRCSCHDFRHQRLGTCKHIEAVRGQAGRVPESPVRAVAPGADLIFFDLETQRLFGDVGGRHDTEKLGLSVAVTLSERDGVRVYQESEVEALTDRLLAADLVVGFNLLNFDYWVLKGYVGGRIFAARTLDLYLALQAAGWRASLEALARATLGTGKSGDGRQAVRWFQEGRLDRVASYCRADVELTRRLFEVGQREGYVRVFARDGTAQAVPAPWAQPPEARVAP